MPSSWWGVEEVEGRRVRDVCWVYEYQPLRSGPRQHEGREQVQDLQSLQDCKSSLAVHDNDGLAPAPVGRAKEIGEGHALKELGLAVPGAGDDMAVLEAHAGLDNKRHGEFKQGLERRPA